MKDQRLHARALREVADLAQETGYGVLAATPSPIEGAEGNREFFLHLRRGSPAQDASALDALVEGATERPPLEKATVEVARAPVRGEGANPRGLAKKAKEPEEGA